MKSSSGGSSSPPEQHGVQCNYYWGEVSPPKSWEVLVHTAGSLGLRIHLNFASSSFQPGILESGSGGYEGALEVVAASPFPSRTAGSGATQVSL